MTDQLFSNKVRVRACAVIVQNSSILLAKVQSPTRSYPIWMPPGGGVVLGETLEDALHREISEETGLKIQKHQLLWVHEFIEPPYHAIEFYFKCEVTGGALKLGMDPELEPENQMIIDIAFMPFKEVEKSSVEPKFIREFCITGGLFFEGVRHIQSSSSGKK